ncbi:hypothetical protein [Rhodophyticola porphyridii]|uniref:hypothetical protein n=1 Tax=Rhodophyticola porphyridii TaxID=1852017 RepID=UPI0035D04FE7
MVEILSFHVIVAIRHIDVFAPPMVPENFAYVPKFVGKALPYKGKLSDIWGTGISSGLMHPRQKRAHQRSGLRVLCCAGPPFSLSRRVGL